MLGIIITLIGILCLAATSEVDTGQLPESIMDTNTDRGSGLDKLSQLRQLDKWPHKYTESRTSNHLQQESIGNWPNRCRKHLGRKIDI